MWFTRKKIGVDYLRQTLALARHVKEEQSADDLKRLLKLISRADLTHLQQLEAETGNKKLAAQTRNALEQLLLSQEALGAGDETPAWNALDNFIKLAETLGELARGKIRVRLTADGIDYIIVTPANWDLYKEGILLVEKTHFGGTELEADEEDLSGFAHNAHDVMIAAIEKGKLVGYIAGEPLRDLPDHEDRETDARYLGIDTDPAFVNGTGFYVASVGVLPGYDKKGVAYVLRTLLAQDAKRKGYKTLHSHNKAGISARNALRMGGKAIRSIQNYYDSGDTYHYIVLDLANYK